MNYQTLKKINDHILLKEIYDSSFNPYGKIITNYDFTELIESAERDTQIPEEGNIYVASVPDFEKFAVKGDLQNNFYGEMPIQIGYCNGVNSTLNGLEYHKGSEINIAVTDMVLMLGKLQDVSDNKYYAADVEVFFVPKGTALQMYETTLHFSPCKTSSSGFKCIVVLLEGTNTTLQNISPSDRKDPLLFARNKWLIAHPQRTPLIQKGAYPGIQGDNIELKTE